MELGSRLRHPERWAKMLGLATLGGLEFGFMGPFGSYNANPFTRVAYWVILFWAAALILVPIATAAATHGARRGFPTLFSGAVGTTLACAPLALLAAGACYLFWPVHASGITPQEYYGSTLAIALPSMAGLIWLEKLVDAAPSPLAPAGSEQPATPAVIPLGRPPLTAIPEHVLTAAECLEMEDHHVRVHGATGSTLHLAAMREAIKVLAHVRGLQVHRSWWVAHAAVRSVEQDGRSVTLVLRNGKRVPVARQRIARLRAEGWL